MTVEQLSWFIDDTVARELQSVKGVGEVKRSGGVDREIRVALDPEKLLALGVTAATVNAQVRADNIDLGGGRGQIGGQEQAIRTLAGAHAVGDLAALPIALPGGRKVRLDELGTVTDGAAEPRTFTRLFDEPIVAFGVTRAKGASDVTVDRLIAERLQRIHAEHPEVAFTKVDTQVDNELGNYSSTMETLIEGALLAVVVVLVFLRDLRATLVTAVALPLSIIPTFWAMDAIGFSLNLVSLLAITLVTGILVDDAIVEIENIVRHMRMGKSAYRASLEAADEIGLAVIAISLTIVAIFSPVSFMSGIAGQYFRQFGLTVAIAVIFSLLVARFITPVIAAYFLRAPDEPTHREGAIMRFYTRLVRASVRHRWITLAAGVMIFVASLMSTKLLPSGFLPPDDQGRVLLAVELPPGSLLADTDRVTRSISDELRAMPEVRSALIYGGQILGSGAEPRKATFVINFVNKRERAASQKDLQARIGAMLATNARHSLSGSSRTTASATSRSSSPGRTSTRSTTPPTSSPARCARSRRSRIRSPPRSSTGRSCASNPSASSPPISASRPKPCPRRSASPRSATSTPISPSSTRATGSFPSASNSTRRRGATSDGSRICASRPRRAAPCRFRSSPISRSTTARRRSIATTARAASPSRAICAARRRWATR